MDINKLKTPDVIAKALANDRCKKYDTWPAWLSSALWGYGRLEVYSLLLSLQRMQQLAKNCLAAANGEAYESLEKQLTEGMKNEKEQLVADFRKRIEVQNIIRPGDIEGIIAAFKEDLELVQMEVPA